MHCKLSHGIRGGLCATDQMICEGKGVKTTPHNKATLFSPEAKFIRAPKLRRLRRLGQVERTYLRTTRVNLFRHNLREIPVSDTKTTFSNTKNSIRQRSSQIIINSD